MLRGTPQMLNQIPHDFSVTLLGKRLTPVPSTKDLGIRFDERLSYDDHVTELASKCTVSLCQINRAKRILDARINTWTKKYDHVTALKQLNWLQVSEQLRYRDIVLAYKCVKGSAPEYLELKFVRKSQKYHSRCQDTHTQFFISAQQQANVPFHLEG